MKKNNEKGMTLVEVVAAMTILAIIFVSFFGLLLQSKKTNTSSESITDATYLAQQQMENYYANAKGKTLTQFQAEFPEIKFDKNEFTGTIPNCTPPSDTASYDNYGKVYIFDEKDSTNSKYKTRIIVKTLCDFENSISFIVQVLDKNTDTSMETENLDVNEAKTAIEKVRPKAMVENVFNLKGGI